MKRKRARAEDQDVADQSVSEPDLEQSAAEEGEEDAEQPTQLASTGHKKRSKLQKRLDKLKDTYDRKGVIYVSRIPPHLKPQKLRHMLSQYGEVNRLYLAPEDASARKRRKKQGKNSGKNFTEGWVEFDDKRVAKRVAEMLNGQPMGGKRRSAYHYDLWCLKYLSKFKWDHLTEEIAYQKAVRDQKLATEISAAKRERDFYMSSVAKAKATAAQKERKLKKQLKEQDSSAAAGAAPADTGSQAPKERLLRTFGQKRAKIDPASEQAPMLAPDVLALIAGKK
ncbi:hypothetical protein CVIRNUC_003132 [Coccomyxa viridis]|uniref:RRM domain-containing protein n=1 Tax=Coccomyxa viridis TaxID=1274662 RepID=A0AAV1HYV0_9CHLO|nr:hypothetical protein CVIRNUC_003132 [Coccomyxa viridis]